MKEEYGFLCVGQAASNIGVQFERLGYNVLYVNTSSEDLNLLKDSSHKYHVEGGEGCAKDRDKAKALLANDIDTLVDLVRTKLPERLIFVVFASGGGTGSGLSPYLLGVLVEEFGADEYDPEKRFAAVTILPTDKEPLQPAINSYNCCKELYDVDGLGAIFFLDNNTRDNKFTINDEFVKGLDEILNIPERHKSTKGNVDKAVILALVRERYTILQKAVKVKYGFPMDNLSEKQLKCFSFWDFNRFLTQRGVTSSADLLKLFLTKVYGSTINDREISEVLKI